ncbi:MAG: GNAT family N-acetyltransferase [Pseudomonadota bacterium]
MLDDTDLRITYSESDTKGRYGATIAGMLSEAELTISKVSPKLIIADHTYVPDELRGRGLARALAAHLVADAREKGQRIVPLCPYLRAYAERHRKDLSDVIQW